LAWAALGASAAAVNAHLEAGASDVWAHALPVFHVGGLGILVRAHLSGARVIAAVEGRWDAAVFHRRVTETKATLSALVPAQVHDLVTANLQAPPSLRAIVVGGARLEPDECLRARALGWPCLPSYGLTETCSQVATAAVAEGRSSICAAAMPVLSHAEIRADNEQRLAIRAASLLSCYAETTAAGVNVWDPKVDGWLVTEDLGRVSDGAVEVVGRASESAKVLGEMVWLPQVEEEARQWAAAEPALAGAGLDLALVGLPHSRLGTELVVVLAAPDRRGLEPLTPTRLWPSLEAWARRTLPPYACPRRIAWVDAIPRTALGKCQRALLSRQVCLEPRTEA
jgi:O-succinylbenzoic acid--CoA ligase